MATSRERQRNARPGARPSGRAQRLRPVQHHIQQRRFQDRMHFQHFARRRRAGEDENAGADDGADPQRGQRPGPQRLAQSVPRRLRVGNQLVDTLLLEEVVMPSGSSPPVDGDCTRPSLRYFRVETPGPFFFTLGLREPRGSVRFGLAAASCARRASTSSVLLSLMFFVFILTESFLRSGGFLPPPDVTIRSKCGGPLQIGSSAA